MGEMLEVELHSKLVYTQIYDPGSIITVTFTETNGITDVATLMKYASLADRDASMSTGMADGMEQSFQALDGVLTS